MMFQYFSYRNECNSLQSLLGHLLHFFQLHVFQTSGSCCLDNFAINNIN